MIDFIVNTHSGGGLGKKNLFKLIDFCHANAIEFAVHTTVAPGHATRIARALCESNAHTIAAVGGDGTFHEVLNGIPSFGSVSLGFIPSGRGNDYARGVGIPLDPIEALRPIAQNKRTLSDYIEVGGKRCLNVAGTGLDIDVLERVAGRNGKITYLKSLIYCLKHFEPYRLRVTDENGGSNEYECVMIGVCNGKQIGGGIKICPEAVAGDGLLDVSIVKMPADGHIFPILPAFVRGRHEKLNIVEHYRCRRVRIETDRPVQLDGEIYRGLDMDCRIAAGGLKTFGPEDAGMRGK